MAVLPQPPPVTKLNCTKVEKCSAGANDGPGDAFCSVSASLSGRPRITSHLTDQAALFLIDDAYIKGESCKFQK